MHMISFRGLILLLVLAGGISSLWAQTNSGAPASPPAAPASHEMRMLSFLTPDEQLEYAKARAKALANNPELKTEGEDLMKEGSAAMAGGTPADQQAFREKMVSHRQKLREAMLKEDPNLGPIFAKIDAHISEMKARQSGEMQRPPGATNAPSGAPAAGA